MEPVFRALADPSRRLLLDRLYERDGQSLGEMETHLPGMTRFGVMKHLRVLEAAGVVVTRKVGREKLHYLNPVPLRRLHDRWLDKFAIRAAVALLDLQATLEGGPAMLDQADVRNEIGTGDRTPPDRVFQIVIRTTPERLWAALTESADTTRYYHGFAVESDWRPGSPYTMSENGAPMITGEVIASDTPRRLVMTFEGRWNKAIAAHPPTRVTYEIEPLRGFTKLTVIHEGLQTDRPGIARMLDGWLIIVGGLKTLLETGEPLTAAAD